jgi:membrane protein YdbS with pleckstrin-like domain
MPSVTLTCDKCDRPFTLQSPAPGAKVTCPACGDVNVYRGPGAPAYAAATAHPDRASSLGLPPAAGPEQTVRLVPGAMFRNRPLSAVFVTCMLVASAIAAGYLGYTGRQTWSMVAAGVGGLCILILIGWKIEAWSERLTITTKRVIMSRGILSKTTVECLHRTIQEISIEQTFWQRVLRVGRMTISNASEGGQEIVVPAAPDPYALRKMIDAYRPM